MNKKIKFLIIFSIIIIIIAIIAIFVINIINKEEPQEKTANIIEETNTEEENVMVVGIEKKQEEEEEPEQEEETQKDAATLTQEIYDLNMEIGTLYIPKTGLTTSIYSSTSVEQMETMPCFLYTTGGLNKTGITLFVGHNRMNGKLFSNNDNLEEGDIFYFTDYKGTELEYTIYSIFITTENDTFYLSTEVDKPVIALSCCTDANDENRLIVMGQADI